MNKLLYEGKAKKVYENEKDKNTIIIYYKDEVTAFNGVKKAVIDNKGIINLEVTNLLYQYLMKNNIKTHLIKKIDERNLLCTKTKVIPLEVIIRNYYAGSLAKKLNKKEGEKLKYPVIEICLKDDNLGDPFINEDHALNLNICTKEELEYIYSQTRLINDLLIKLLDKANIILVDMKIEFGKDKDNNILLIDEISLDTSRFWDKTTLEKMDKDRFRRDMGNVIDYYNEFLQRIKKVL